MLFYRENYAVKLKSIVLASVAIAGLCGVGALPAHATIVPADPNSYTYAFGRTVDTTDERYEPVRSSASASQVVKPLIVSDMGGSGATSATADLSTGQLRVSGTAATSGPYVYGGGVSYEADAQYRDVLTLHLEGASSGTVTSIPITVSLYGNSSAANDTSYVAQTLNFFAENMAGTPYAVIHPVLDEWNNFDNIRGPILYKDTLQMVGADATVDVYFDFHVWGGGNATSNFTDAGVTFDLPSGVTMSSQSGVFLTGSSSATAIPEPGSIMLFSMGVLGLISIRAVRRHTRASQGCLSAA